MFAIVNIVFIRLIRSPGPMVFKSVYSKYVVVGVFSHKLFLDFISATLV